MLRAACLQQLLMHALAAQTRAHAPLRLPGCRERCHHIVYTSHRCCCCCCCLHLHLQPSRYPLPGDPSSSTLQGPLALPDAYGFPAGRSVFFDAAATAQLSGSLGCLRRLAVLRLAGVAGLPAALSRLSCLRELR
jgi:hypothetical protein